MSATVQPEPTGVATPQPAPPGRAEFDLTEFDKSQADAKSAAPTAESLAAAAQLGKLQESLRLSEEARFRAIAEAEAAKAAARVAAPAAPAPAAPVGPRDMTEEELETLLRDNPKEAMIKAMEQTRRKTMADVESRLGPMAAAGYSASEQAARAKYAEDFEVMGDKIDEFIKTQIPVDKRAAALGDLTNWGTMIDYIRGQNVDRIIEHRQKKAGATTRAAQVAAAPVSIASGVVAPVGAGAGDGGISFDATTVEIMQNILGVEDSPAARAEWVKWHKAGRQM